MKILILSSRFPYPIEKGDKLRLYYQIRELSKKHELVLCSLSETLVSEEAMKHLQPFCKHIYVFQLSKFSIFWHVLKSFWIGEAAQLAYFYRKGLHERIKAIVKKEMPDHIFCQLIRMAHYTKDLSVKSTIDYMDAFSMGMERRAKYSSFWQRFFFKREAKILQSFEVEVLAEFNHHTIIAQKDKTHIENCALKRNSTYSIPPIHIISNGIDLDYFQADTTLSSSYDLVFVGNMGYFPNITAAQYIVQKIFPLIKKKYPHIKILLAGANPSPVVKTLNKYQEIDVSGWMPDIRKAYSQGKIFVAPLFTGSGQQNKILEAMAIGVPVITTSSVNQAIGAQNKKTIFLAETPEEFSKCIDYLLSNPQICKNVSTAARSFVENNFSWEASIHKLEQVWDISS